MKDDGVVTSNEKLLKVKINDPFRCNLCLENGIICLYEDVQQIITKDEMGTLDLPIEDSTQHPITDEHDEGAIGLEATSGDNKRKTPPQVLHVVDDPEVNNTPPPKAKKQALPKQPVPQGLVNYTPAKRTTAPKVKKQALPPKQAVRKNTKVKTTAVKAAGNILDSGPAANNQDRSTCTKPGPTPPKKPENDNPYQIEILQGAQGTCDKILARLESLEKKVDTMATYLKENQCLIIPCAPTVPPEAAQEENVHIENVNVEYDIEVLPDLENLANTDLENLANNTDENHDVDVNNNNSSDVSKTYCEPIAPAVSIDSTPKVLTPTKLRTLKCDSCSRTNFSWKLAKDVFTRTELLNGNCRGVGKDRLDPEKLDYIKKQTFIWWPADKGEDETKCWRDCEKSIDKGARTLRSAARALNLENS